MTYLNKILLTGFLLISLSSCRNTSTTDLDYCNQQINKTIKEVKDSRRMPRNIAHGASQWNTVSIGDWTSGFFPGTLWYGYEYSKDETIKQQAIHFTELLAPLSKKSRDHDLGFQIMCSYGNAYRLTKNKQYKEIILQSAETLSKLYNPRVGTILSWPWKVKENGWPHNTIIDNMMNLELLFWAAKNGGEKRYYDIALSHARVTKANHFREDGSCYHVAVYDTINGGFIKGVTHQGYSDDSMWARGQAWAIYGYTMVYRETGDKEFLRFAEKVADIYIHRLPDDLIPYWDFNVPNIPDAPKDASAAAITASALLELSTLEDNPTQANKYKEIAEQMLRTLSSEQYQSREKNPSFLLHSTGHLPGGTEIDASIIYADYYYIEALTRLKRIKENQPITETKRFIHPGILHTKESLDRIQSYATHKEGSAYHAYQLLESDPLSSYQYQMQGPFEIIARRE